MSILAQQESSAGPAEEMMHESMAGSDGVAEQQGALTLLKLILRQHATLL